MNTPTPSVLTDRELVRMLIDEPELLALADALVATKTPPQSVRVRRMPWRRRRAMSAAMLAAVFSVGALLLVSPWQGNPSFVQRALAVVSGGPVLHVVVSQPALGDPIVDLKTGKAISRTLETEIWFDGTRDLKKTVFRLDGQVLDEQLETSRGGWTRTGPIYTCAWIAAHPAEATRAGVSCNANGDNGTNPRVVPKTPPTLEPAVAGFVDHYRSALGLGDAKETGRGPFEGHDVVWLEFRGNGATERVAVDAHTYAPLLIEQDGEPTHRVLAAEALTYDERDFRKPERVEAQSGGSVASEREITPGQAEAVLDARPLWLGKSWNGLQLTNITLEERIVRYGPERVPGRVTVLHLTYALGGAGASQPRVDIYEATSCVLSVGWTCTPLDPTSSGTVGLFGFITRIRSAGLHISIWDPGRTQDPIEIARALEPVVGPSR